MTDGPEHASTQLGPPLPATPPLGLDALVGSVIAGRYRIDAPLGEGGMGAVFDGHHLGLDRAIAVKVLRPEFVSDPQVSSRFEREAQAVSRLEHPSIVQVFDVGTAEVAPLTAPISYIVMERLRGCELSDTLGKPLPEAVALDHLAQVLGALAHAHSRGVVHRDLKPENIFVTRDAVGAARLKLVDFGIAKMLEPQDGAVLTQLGMVFGTPGYMSPEQCIGAEIDGRSDLYSAGIVFFEMLMGHCPFAAPEMMDVLRMHINAPLPAVPGIGDFAAEVLGRLASKKPGDRYPSAAAAHAALTAHLQPAAPAERPAPPPSPTGPPVASPPAAPSPIDAPVPPGGSASPPSRPASMAIGVGLAGLVAAVLVGWALWPETVAEDATQNAKQDARQADSPLAAAEAFPPSVPRAAEEARIEALLKAGDKDAAEESLRALVEQHPRQGRLHWRLAEITDDPKRPSPNRARSIGHALRLDPDRLKDTSARAFVMREAQRRSVPDPLLDALVQHGASWTPQWVDALLVRERYALTYAQRHQLLDAWSDSAAINDDLRRQHRCLDLWQAPKAASPCEAYDAALTQMQDDPSATYRRSLGSAPVPAGSPGDTACAELDERRDALYKQLKDAEGDANYVPADYASRAKPRATAKRKGRARPLQRAVKSLFD